MWREDASAQSPSAKKTIASATRREKHVPRNAAAPIAKTPRPDSPVFYIVYAISLHSLTI